jgi:hypothetical protein
MSNATPYPVEIRGDLAPSLNRWLFLIKWILIIPHLIVLAVLAVGLVFSWLFSLAAILFTGKYPEGLPLISSGRVTHYCSRTNTRLSGTVPQRR